MILAPVSVIVVSRGRPDHLSLCLKALMAQDHSAFEIVLVADTAGLNCCPELPIKRVSFDQPNISEARNLGLAMAAGKIVAFIDDDSVAEPTWLSRLTAPFAEPGVIAATGWTRDRDGFRWQSRSARMTTAGLPEALDHPGTDTLLIAPENGAPVSTLGTNCAFRADTLRAIGGFDPAFPYHLDESDVNLRMAAALPEAMTAIVPMAQMIHARAGSAQRDSASVPQDMTMIGRSAAIFWRRYKAVPAPTALLVRTRQRLLRHMLDGRLDPLRIKGILATLESGLTAGHTALLPAPPPARLDNPPPFLAVPPAQAGHVVFGGWHWQARSLRALAGTAARAGKTATVILLTPSLLPHRVRYTAGGWFEQTGGLWGPSEPGDPVFMHWRLRERLDRETELSQARRNSTTAPGVGALRLFRNVEPA